jgi:hypothetical protein
MGFICPALLGSEIDGSTMEFCVKKTNSKHQITNKSQIPIINDQNLPRRDIVWILEFWSLEICLIFGI